jgi:hypothetical protein
MLFLTAVLTLAPASAGDEPPSAAAAAAPALRPHAPQPLDGIVTNGTFTLAGQAFYRQFCLAWYDKPLNEMFAIAIRECTSARRGNQVVVEHSGRVLFQGALPPFAAGLGQVSQQAVEVSYEAVVNAEVQRLLFSQDELAPDEI